MVPQWTLPLTPDPTLKVLPLKHAPPQPSFQHLNLCVAHPNHDDSSDERSVSSQPPTVLGEGAPWNSSKLILNHNGENFETQNRKLQTKINKTHFEPLKLSTELLNRQTWFTIKTKMRRKFDVL